MGKKAKIITFIILLCISLTLNIYLGINNYIKSTYTPDSDDREVLAEMTKMVLDSEQYKKIASKEHVYAIEQGVSRFNVADPSSVFHYEVYVKTDQQSYIFMCKDKACSDVKNEGWTYSRYSNQRPILPLNKNN